MSDENAVETTETGTVTAETTENTDQSNETGTPVEGQTEQEAKTEAPETTDATSDDAKQPVEDAEKKRRKESAQERINRSVAKQREAERDANRWKQKFEALQDQQKPDPASFDDLDELNAAQTRHALNEARKAEVEADAKGAAEDAAQARQDAWVERSMLFKEDVPDFEQVAGYAPISDPVAELIKTMDQGPAVAYYLGKNPMEARQVSQLSEREAAIRLGRIEGKLSTPPTRRVTQAPEPVKTVTGKSPGTGPSIHDPKISMKEYSRQRAQMQDRIRVYGDPNQK